MPCFSCICFRDGRGRSGERLDGGRGWCQLHDQEYYRGHECSDYAPEWYGSGGSDSALGNTGGCFLTGACTAHLGLPDNCTELTELRVFRDKVLRQTAEGRLLIDEYYRIAPGIVRRIENDPRKDAVYDEIYQVLRSCLDAIHRGNDEQAVETYQSMVLALSGRAGSAVSFKLQ